MNTFHSVVIKRQGRRVGITFHDEQDHVIGGSLVETMEAAYVKLGDHVFDQPVEPPTKRQYRGRDIAWALAGAAALMAIALYNTGWLR